MTMNKIKKILIVGGGTAGWMTAAALSHLLPKNQYSIELIESEKIGTIGVGEATIPHIRFFNNMLGIDEAEFMHKTQATYKLGIELNNWGNIGDSYIHPFGDYGESHNNISFHHYWLKLKQQGFKAPLSNFSVPIVAAKNNKFALPHTNKESLLSMYGYAFHLDASQYANFLREYSEQRGVVRCEGLITKSHLDPHNGFIKSVELESGKKHHADLFIDCSGFSALLIEKALKTGYQHWDKWFICDRAIAVASKKPIAPSAPYTQAIASDHGWKWRIPLQNRMGNGYVYSSRYCSDEQAKTSLLNGIKEELLNEPKIIRFSPGRRKKSWNKNCVAIGLSAGFLEPLESTSLFLIQIGITKLLEFFPSQKFDPIISDEYNRVMENEYTRVKDFLILHYCATQRRDTPFWQHVGTMTIPKSLRDKIELFKETGHVEHYQEGLFLEPSWLAVLLGQGIEPKQYHPFVNSIDEKKLFNFAVQRQQQIQTAVQSLPMHDDTIARVYQSATKNYSATPAAMNLYGYQK